MLLFSQTCEKRMSTQYWYGINMKLERANVLTQIVQIEK